MDLFIPSWDYDGEIMNSRRQFISRAAGLGSVGIGSAALAAQTSRAAVSRPNIVYLHSHDSGRYLHPYGHAAPTPSIHNHASGCILTRPACSVAPTCSPRGP